MVKAIVSGGCSFAYGFNLVYRDDRYAVLLADHYNADLIDVSGPGKSNETIAASISYGLNQAIKKYEPEDIVVIAGWTETARMEYWDKRRANLQTCYLTGFVPQGIPAEIPRLTEISNFITNKLWDPCYSYYRLLHAFNYVHALCEASGVRVVHLKNLNIFEAHMPNYDKNRKDSIRLIDYTDDIFPPKVAEAFNQMYSSISFRDLILKDERLLIAPGVDHHPNEIGHSMWADKIKQTYNNIIQ